MSRTRSRRSTGTRAKASEKSDAPFVGAVEEEAVLVDDIAFQPSVACGGRKLSTSEYNLRSRKLQGTPEFKTWQQGSEPASPLVAAARAAVRAALSPAGLKVLAALTVVALLAFLPLLAPGLAGEGRYAGEQRAAAAPADSIARASSAPFSGIKTPVPPPAAITTQGSDELLRQERERAEGAAAEAVAAKRAAAEAVAAKRAAAAAQEQQRQLVMRLEEANKREAALTAETKRLTAQQQPKTAAATAATALWQRPDAGLLTLEAALVVLAAVLLAGLRRSRTASDAVKKEYLVAYRRQQAALARAEDSYQAAATVQATAERVVMEARAKEQEAEAAMAAAAAAQAAAAAAIAAAKEKEESGKEVDKEDNAAAAEERAALERAAEEAAARAAAAEAEAEAAAEAAAAHKASWASTAAQLLQLAASTPPRGSPSSSPTRPGSAPGPTRSPPSPGAVAQAVADRCAALRARALSAEDVADLHRRERMHSDARASEAITDAELMKERLSDAKRALDDALDAKHALQEREEELRAALEAARGNVAAVTAERIAIDAEAAALREQLSGLAEEAEGAATVGDRLEAQLEQLTASLGEAAAGKASAEQRAAALEADASALRILAESLEGQVASLERQLAEAVESREALRAAAHHLQAVHAAAGGADMTPIEMATLFNAQSRLLTAVGVPIETPESPLPAMPFPAMTPRSSDPDTVQTLITRTNKIKQMLNAANFDLMKDGDEQLSPMASPMPPLSARRLSAEAPLSARMGRAMGLFEEAQGALGAALPGDAQFNLEPRVRGGSGGLASWAPPAGNSYREPPRLLREGATEARRRAVDIQRRVASQDTAIAAGAAEAIALETQLAALGGTDAEGTALAALREGRDRLAAAQAARAAATAAHALARDRWERQDAVSGQRQRMMDEAKHEFSAAMAFGQRNGSENEEEREIAVMVAAEHLEAVAAEARAAAAAVEDSEKAHHAAAVAELAAFDGVVAGQEALAAALAGGRAVVEAARAAGAPEARSVSPRSPLPSARVEEAPVG